MFWLNVVEVQVQDAAQQVLDVVLIGDLDGRAVAADYPVSARRRPPTGGLVEQRVKFRMCLFWKLGTVLARGDDHFELAADIGDRAGEDLVRPVSEARQA